MENNRLMERPMETTDKELKNQENYQQNEPINREIIKRN